MLPLPRVGGALSAHYVNCIRPRETCQSPAKAPTQAGCAAGGKIAELWITWDNLTLLTQLGRGPAGLKTDS
jgi:hypothetical protein